jgi:Ca-activated chloride channel family protein
MIRDLDDAYAANPSDELAQRIVDTSLRFGVLSRFTGFLAVDSRIDNATGELHRVIQPVELPAGWAPASAAASAAVPLGFTAARLAAGQTHAVPRAALLRAGGPAQASSVGRVANHEPDLANLHDLAATEARRLERRPDSEREMRDLLDDLATRLEAMLRHLDTLGGDTTRLAAILELLLDQSLATTERWDRAKRALRDLAAPQD